MEQDSLIERDRAQLALPLSDETIAAQSRAGEFTGEQLFRREPAKYREIVSMTAEGMGVHRIARVLKVSGHTVRAVRSREGLEIATGKKEMAANCRQFAGLAVERLIEEVDSIDLKTLPVAFGILVEKAELLDGNPTQIIETRNEAASLDDFEEMLEDLPAAKVISVSDAEATGFEGGKSLETREAADGPLVGDGAAGVDPVAGAVDGE